MGYQNLHQKFFWVLKLLFTKTCCLALMLNIVESHPSVLGDCGHPNNVTKTNNNKKVNSTWHVWITKGILGQWFLIQEIHQFEATNKKINSSIRRCLPQIFYFVHIKMIKLCLQYKQK